MSLLKYDQVDRGWWFPRHPFVAVHDCVIVFIGLSLATITSGWDQCYFVVVVLMYAASAVHHWSKYAVWLHRLDRAMIYLLIGGTVLPYVVQIQVLGKGWALFILAGVVTSGVFLKVLGVGARKGLVATLLYLTTGISSVYCMLNIDQFHDGLWVVLFWSGVGLYLLQLISYNRNWFDFRPKEFGFREVQHLILLLAFIDHSVLAIVY